MHSFRSFPAIFTTVCLLLLAGCSRQARPLPNIIIIFTDDQGYADLGCFGATDFDTPNIDRLADEGMRFTNFYVSEAVCSASRSSLLTGCYAQRVGIRGALSPFAMTGLNPEEETIASMLKKRGYATGMVGKWHLGSRAPFFPTNYGFDEYLGIPYSNDMWPVGYDGLRPAEGYKSIYPELPLIEDDSVIATFETLEAQNKITGMYTDRAVNFIKKNAGQPFFLYLAHSMVHVPLAVGEQFRGSSRQGMYGDVMQEVDWSVGRIAETLAELGLEDNTLIIYTSDNGPWLNFGNHAGSAFPLREGKGNSWEGGVRVPCVMHFPALIPEGTSSSKMAATIDLLPTLASLTGAPLPDREIDGVSILPLMMGKEDATPRNEYVYYYEGGLNAVRRGDYKLVVPHKYRSYEGVEAGRDGMPGPYSRGQAGLELYNLATDISERNDLAALHPEIVDKLLVMADSVRNALGDRITGVRGNTNRSPGRIRMIDEKTDHKAKGKKYTLKHEPSHRYPGGTEYALTDGFMASLEFTDESWAGFHGTALEVLIDMEEDTCLESVEINFLSNQASWIFLPEHIQIYAGHHPSELECIVEKAFSVPEKELDISKKPFRHELKVEARYLKIHASGPGKCPGWHPGKGEQAWLFVDEIVLH